MIVHTRYRDISFEESAKCSRVPVLQNKSARRVWETKMRGKPVSIETPELPKRDWKYFCCSGPFYKVHPPTLSMDGENVVMVCVHVAEIGD